MLSADMRDAGLFTVDSRASIAQTSGKRQAACMQVYVFNCGFECTDSCEVTACFVEDKRLKLARREPDLPLTGPGRLCKKTSDSGPLPVNRCTSKQFYNHFL